MADHPSEARAGFICDGKLQLSPGSMARTRLEWGRYTAIPAAWVGSPNGIERL